MTLVVAYEVCMLRSQPTCRFQLQDDRIADGLIDPLAVQVCSYTKSTVLESVMQRTLTHLAVLAGLLLSCTAATDVRGSIAPSCERDNSHTTVVRAVGSHCLIR